MTHSQNCRSCGAKLVHTFVDLGLSPVANDYLRADQLTQMEPFYPLNVLVCDQCWLVQLRECQSPEHIFSDHYAYFSSYSDSWLRHAQQYVEMTISRFKLNASSRVIEVASNDGYLLQYFVARGIPVLGIDPAANVAAAAEKKGVRTLVRFFGTAVARELAAEGTQADLLLGNNVLAHVPDLNDFVAGLKAALKPRGVLTMEFPHLLQLMEQNQFDTIYHEHFSYFSLTAVRKVFASHGLEVFDIDELPTHGGSLRVYASHPGTMERSARVEALLAKEESAGLTRVSTYAGFTQRVEATKRKLLQFLIEARNAGKSIAGYGAAAKGNTLLNYCGIRTDFLDYVVDRSPHKQGLFLPGTRIPIYPPEKILETKPDYLLILPWNLRDEIREQMKAIRNWGGRFVVPIPEVRVLD
jgi:SAM-dependent methyltransferase